MRKHACAPSPTSRRGLWIGVALLCAAAAPAIAANVVPTLTLPDEFADEPEAVTYEGAYRTAPMWNAGLPEIEYETRSDFVVALRGKGDSELGSATATTLRIVGGAITPAVSVVRAGGSLVIENASVFTHHPYVADGSFDFTMLVPKAPSSELALTEPGELLIRDHRWPHLKAKVVVVAGALFSDVDENGFARFEEVPPGAYTLQVYFRGYLIREDAVEVPDTPRDLKIPVELEAFEAPEEPDEAPASAPASAPARDSDEDPDEDPDDGDEGDDDDAADSAGDGEG